MIALARNFPDSVRYQDRARWSQTEVSSQPGPLTELNGQLLLIVGYGSIGRELARRARAFDMRVWGVTRSGKGDATHAEKILPVAQLEDALPARRLHRPLSARHARNEATHRSRPKSQR